MNRLSKEKSPYLRHAAQQKIDWYPWSDEAFETAKQEDKPVFLSSGALWCHWCHVMAKDCFENEEIAQFLNEHFINIKLDRDERPEIDRRYQRAVSAMGAGGGWPLSVFLMPDKMPFFGGTYFPPDDIQERPGFKKVIKTVLDFYRTRKEDIIEVGKKLIGIIKPKPLVLGDLDESFLDDAVKTILSQSDLQNGGFGSSPKFPMPGAIAFLLNRFFFTKDESIAQAVKKTLESMANGGIHDQLGGGFHRYSVDEQWIIPHFEKMADDNAWILRNYIDAYSVFEDDYFKDVAQRIIDFILGTLSDPKGGFYASQDADVTPDDEGGYFTWTEKDCRNVLNDDEYRVISLHLFQEKGSMHHDPAKKVLSISMDARMIAAKTGMDEQTVIALIKRGKGKLFRKRQERTAPPLDKTFYTSLNGMMITSFLNAYRVLNETRVKEFALKSLHRILDEHLIHDELFHTNGVKALLDDYMCLIDALITAYEVTGDAQYYKRADELMLNSIVKFWDNTEGGFFDTGEEVLGVRLKDAEDIPHPSSNALGIMLLLKLYHMTDKQSYYQLAETALKAFSLLAKGTGIVSGYYCCALDTYFNMSSLQFDTAPESALSHVALASFIPYRSVVYGEDRGQVTLCFRNTCFEPIDDPDKLKDVLKNPGSEIQDKAV
jgi:uncharacterized protein YyaL (SSP411 family)